MIPSPANSAGVVGATPVELKPRQTSRLMDPHSSNCKIVKQTESPWEKKYSAPYFGSF